MPKRLISVTLVCTANEQRALYDTLDQALQRYRDEGEAAPIAGLFGELVTQLGMTEWERRLRKPQP